MKIEVNITGNTYTEQWKAAKLACKAAMDIAVARFNTEAARVKEACGQEMDTFYLPEGKEFHHVYVDKKEVGGYLGTMSHYSTFGRDISENWKCSLKAVIELTIALNCTVFEFKEE